MAIGQEIKKTRKKKQLTLNELAKKSGVSQPYLSQLETGKNNNPTSDTLIKIAKGLDIPYIELLQKAGYIDDKDMEVMDDAENILKMMSNNGYETHTPPKYKILLDEILSNETLVGLDREYLTNEEKKEILNFARYLKANNKEGE